MPFRVDDIEEVRLRRLYGYWRGQCEGATPMSRSRLDPGPIAALLANVVLIEVVPDNNDLRIRLAGDEIESRYGRSLKGRSVYDTFPLVVRHDTSHQWAEILRDGCPKYRRGPMTFPDGRTFVTERLLLPLSEGECCVAYILGGFYYMRVPPGDRAAATLAATVDP